jgi:hypothetical protein
MLMHVFPTLLYYVATYWVACRSVRSSVCGSVRGMSAARGLTVSAAV